MTLSLPFSAALIALLTRDRQPAAPTPVETAPPDSNRLRRDIGLPPEPAAPSALAIALRARGDL